MRLHWVDWAMTPNLSWRTNLFYTDSRDQIAYGQLNVLNNVYSHTIAGAETELLVGADVGLLGRVGGFVNYAYSHLVKEDTFDPTISKSNQLTWMPAHTAKAGVNVNHGPVSASLQALYYGSATRRASDLLLASNRALRPDKAAAWVTADVNVAYALADWCKLSVRATNIFASAGRIIKNGDYAFDYHTEPRQVLGTVAMEL